MVEKEDNARCIGDLLVANLDKKRGMVALNIELVHMKFSI